MYKIGWDYWFDYNCIGCSWVVIDFMVCNLFIVGVWKCVAVDEKNI